jgi:hypothetical protein
VARASRVSGSEKLSPCIVCVCVFFFSLISVLVSLGIKGWTIRECVSAVSWLKNSLYSVSPKAKRGVVTLLPGGSSQIQSSFSCGFLSLG